MLPNSGNSSPELPHKKLKPLVLFDRKNSFNSSNFGALLQQFHHHQSRIWLLLAVLSVQILLLFTMRYLPLPQTVSSGSLHRLPSPVTATDFAEIPSSSSSGFREDDPCRFGRIFVYDLPATFNREILDNCDNWTPWSSSCSVLSNYGLGPRADSLAGVIPEKLVRAWFWTDQFVTEIIFHKRILKHECRVSSPESATAFYVPFYAGLAVGKYLWINSTVEERDQPCVMMLRWLQDQPYYKNSGGWDHFMTMGRITWDFRRTKVDDWGSGCIHLPGMRNITRLLIERNPWDYFDVGLPYPTGFHPSSVADISDWQHFVRTRNRTHLFCFAGATRAAFKNDFRSLLLSQCRNEPESCRVVDCGGNRCSNGTSAILETFLSTDFCLQPRGDSFTRRSIFDCMVAGSIPVFFWKRTAYYQYEWFLPNEPSSYSVFIDRNEVKNGTISIKEVLEKFSREEVRKMREKVIDFIPRFVYAKREDKDEDGTNNFKDAFDVAIDRVLRRFKEQEDWGYKWK